MRSFASGFAIAAMLVTTGCAQAPVPSPETVAAHVAEARRLAANDLKSLLSLCFDSPLWGRPPRFDASRDRRMGDGSKLVLGDTAVTLYLTPGHTEGTLTLAFDVTVAGKPHRALLWGGTAFNFGKDLARLESYIAATRRMAEIARDRGIDVMISNHPSSDDSIAKMEAMRSGVRTHPFVIGNEAVVRSLQVMGSCAKAQRDRFSMR